MFLSCFERQVSLTPYLQWLYIIVGSVNVVFALAALVMLPDFPESTTGSQKWLLTEEERRVANERIMVDRIAQESNRSVWYGLKLAVTDYRTWAFVRTSMMLDKYQY